MVWNGIPGFMVRHFFSKSAKQGISMIFVNYRSEGLSKFGLQIFQYGSQIYPCHK